MVVSHRETTISSNIRAIIQQLNLNPVERRRLIEARPVDEIDRFKQQQHLNNQQQQHKKHIIVESTTRPRVTIGVYGGGLKQRELKEKISSCNINNNNNNNNNLLNSKSITVGGVNFNLRSTTIGQISDLSNNGNNNVDGNNIVVVQPRKIVRRLEVRPRQRLPPVSIELDELLVVPRQDAPTPTAKDADVPPITPTKDELPELPTGSLNHTAALHRISVRPKNRRPPKRCTPQPSENGSLTMANGLLPRIDSLSENSIDTMDSLEAIPPAATSSNDNLSIGSSSLDSPTTKPIPILRKSSSRLSRNSDVFEELEAKLPALRKPVAASPDSLESNLDSKSAQQQQHNNDALLEDASEEVAKSSPNPPKPSPRSASTSSTDGHERSRRSSSNRLSKSPDSLESDSPGWLTKSIEGFDKLSDFERESSPSNKPVPAARRLLLSPISKSQERVCSYSKSTDSLEALEASLNNSDDSMESSRRRSSFEARTTRASQVRKAMSKSSECFEEQQQQQQQQQQQRVLMKIGEEKPKRASVSEMNLSRGTASGRYAAANKTESFEKLVEASRRNNAAVAWRGSRRLHSSESSDNLDAQQDDKLENRRRSIAATRSGCHFATDEQQAARTRKSSESSELGSTDTLDSERRNACKSSDSDETLDSLEKDPQQQDEETAERREKDEEQQPIWRRRANSHEAGKERGNDLDIHQLMAYSTSNGNDGDATTGGGLLYPSKKLKEGPSSDDDKTTANNANNQLSSAKTMDEDLQNMLNGNMSEVSTDAKSFREKLIMFEKLGK